MSKMTELQEQVAKLQEQVEGTGGVLRGLGVVTVVFGPDGQVLQLVSGDLETTAGLGAARVALRQVASFVEERVVRAQVAAQVQERLGKKEVESRE